MSNKGLSHLLAGFLWTLAGEQGTLVPALFYSFAHLLTDKEKTAVRVTLLLANGDLEMTFSTFFGRLFVLKSVP